MPPPPGTRHRICCATGSHATSAPLLVPSIGSGPIAGGGGSVAAGAGRTVPVVRPGCGSNVGSAAYTNVLLVDVGMYVSPVIGLNDIGDQLCAPPPPGVIDRKSVG